MTEEEKIKLIDAVNCKFPHNNIMELYYNIGRALPFTAQRFPDGRVSDWYRSQYVQVVKVMPHGKYGKYGKAFGFYYRNGERADSSDEETLCWCKKDETEPQVAHGDSWTYKGNPVLKSQNCWGLMMSSTLANTKA